MLSPSKLFVLALVAKPALVATSRADQLKELLISEDLDLYPDGHLGMRCMWACAGDNRRRLARKSIR